MYGYDLNKNIGTDILKDLYNDLKDEKIDCVEIRLRHDPEGWDQFDPELRLLRQNDGGIKVMEAGTIASNFDETTRNVSFRRLIMIIGEYWRCKSMCISSISKWN